MGIKWNNSVVLNAEEEYSQIQIDPEGRQIVELVANLLCEYIAMRKMAMKGFCWRSIVKWQKEHSRPISDLATMNPSQRISIMKSLLVDLEATLNDVLRNKEMKSVITDGITKALEFYISNFVNVSK